MALGDLHVFTGEEYVDTELAPLLNENFNSLKEYVDDASRWQVMPVQFKGTNAKFLIHETTLGTGTIQVLPLVVLDNTDIAKFSACSLKVVMSTKNGSTAAVNCDISLQKVHNSNECNVNFNTTNSDDAKTEPCTFTYNNIKYAGLKLTTGNADTLWVSGYTTEEWVAPVVDTSVTNLVTLGSDMNVIPTLFKSLQTDKSPVNDYDVVNKKSLNDLTNIKTYSQLSQIGLSGGVLDNSPYAIGNALPANSMLIIGINGEGNTYNYPSQTGNLTVVRANTNHVFYEITTESGNGYVVNYVLQFTIDTASEDTNYVWKRVLTDVDTGYWQPNETVTKGTVRKLLGAKYAGCFLVCKVAGTTGSTQPSPDPADGAGIGGGSGSITFYSSLEEIGITPGQELAKQSDLTNLSNSVVKSVNGIKPTNGNVNITGVPTGTILPFAGGTIPEGFLACNGAAVSRTTYSALFSAIGTTYGSGDGSTTFNLPAVEDNRFLEFSSTRGTKKNAGLPNITGIFGTRGLEANGAYFDNGCFYNAGGFAYAGGADTSALKVGFNASRSNSIYGNSNTVQPKSLTVRAIIKY